MCENKREHPSYGMLLFGRTFSNESIPLFGSSIKHENIITMTLKRASMERSLYEDRYYGGGTIAKVKMSYSQFAELITSMNMGDGVPVTITYTEKDGRIEKTPFESKQEQFRRKFSEHLNDIKQEVKDAINGIREMFNSKSNIGKKDREEIIKRLENLGTQIGSNSEFVYSQFNEQMDKTVTEAKCEIESFWQNKINSIENSALMEKEDNSGLLEYPMDIVKLNG